MTLTIRILAARFVVNEKGKRGERPAALGGPKFAGLWRRGNSHQGKPGQEGRFAARLPTTPSRLSRFQRGDTI